MKLYSLFLLLFFTFGTLSEMNGETKVKEVHFKTYDGGQIYGNLYGLGEHAVLLAHGAIFNKESWDVLAKQLARQGYLVLAIDFRGYGKSKPGKEGRVLFEDVLAGVRFLRKNGAKRISVLGASMGGGAVARAAVAAKKDEIGQVILLSPVPIRYPEKMQGDKLFIVSKGERLFPRVKEQFDRAVEPKKFIILDGNAHAQHIFKTGQAEKLTKAIFDFLARKSYK